MNESFWSPPEPVTVDVPEDSHKPPVRSVCSPTQQPMAMEYHLQEMYRAELAEEKAQDQYCAAWKMVHDMKPADRTAYQFHYQNEKYVAVYSGSDYPTFYRLVE